MVYVYGVVRSRALGSLPVEGIAGGSVELVEDDGLAAVATRLPPGRLRVRRRELSRHLGVLQEAFEQTTVVPCGFGLALESKDAVRHELLRPRRDQLLADLRRLDGRSQINVKTSYDEEAVLRDIVTGEPEIARLRQATARAGAAAYYDNIRLGELVTAALAARRAHDAQRVYDRLAAEAEAAVVEEARDLLILKASFLVEDQRRGRFEAGLEKLADENAPLLRFEEVGPLPPTAFVTPHEG